MTQSFRLPDLGEGVHEAEILAVHVAVGQSIKEGELLLEVETDKAAVEIPSPITGTVSEVLAKKGDMAGVGDILINFGETAEAVSAPAPETAPKTAPKTAPETAQAGSPAAESEAAPAPPERKADRQTPAPQAARTADQSVPASPATRRLARELGVDLRQVTASGAGGVVSADDVRSFAEEGKPAQEIPSAEQPSDEQRSAEQPSAEAKPAAVSAPAGLVAPPAGSEAGLPDFSQWGPVVREPFRSIRRATAAHMISSWVQIPHVNCQDTVDITRLEEFRQRHKAEIEEAGGRLTMTVFAMKAVATTLKKYPHFNASLDLASQEIIVKQYYHIGIAADTEHGLMVPVIRDVDRKSIRELAVELQGTLDRARQRKNSREEMLGGTFTITNVGGLGGSSFSAIINHPEVAILGLGQGRMQPAVVTDDNGEHEIVPRLIMPIVVCFDHRVVDGADAVRFLRQVIDLLEDPDELFITMI
jgi:pyruvate dehydrogenase E2 component (dihydrolipoamide acetyltransferase)